MKDIAFCVRFLTALSWRTDRRRLARGGVLLLLGFLATPLVAVALRELVNAMTAGRSHDAVRWAALAAVMLIGELMLGHFAHLSYFELGEINEQTLSRELLRLVNGTRGLEQCDDPRYADSVDLLRQDILKMRVTVQAALELAGLIGQAIVTMAVLGTVLPWLLLLPPMAVVPVLAGKRAERVLERARDEAAPVARAIRHLRTLAASPESQKEIRLAGSAGYLIARHQELQRRLAVVLGPAQRRHAALRGLGQLAFGVAYVGSLVAVFQLARQGHATLGDVVLVVVLATAVNAQVTTGVELLGSVHAAATGFRRLAGLATAARDTGPQPHEPVGVDRLHDGIRLERLSFSYPNADQPVLHEIDLHFPAGASVALVGENGAGKSTMIKLLSGLYQPTAGRILIDGVDLATVDAAAWRRRTATLFQDFARLDFTLQHSIGVGRLADIESPAAVEAAIDRARAGTLLARLDGRLDTLLGHGYGDGTDLSGGQWQSVGFARTLMRPDPLMLSLDEPGHALDALAEQQMCEAYREVAADVAVRAGALTVFVTHRLSTVALADIVVVLSQGRVVEVGSHAELVSRRGHYAEMYHLQSRTYQ